MKKDYVIRVNPSIYGRLVELKKDWDLARVDYVIKVLLDYYQYDMSIADILPKMAKRYKTKWYAQMKYGKGVKQYDKLWIVGNNTKSKR